MRLSCDELVMAVTEPGEALTVPDIVGRLMDAGYSHIPTSASIARALQQHPDFHTVLTRPRQYRRF